MKKLICLACVLALILCLAACTRNDAGIAPTPTVAAATDAPTDAPIQQPTASVEPTTTDMPGSIEGAATNAPTGASGAQ